MVRAMRVLTSPSASAPLAIVELPSRPLGPRDVRVRVRAIGVNPVDWKMREGGPLRIVQWILGPPGPIVLGIDFAGDVVEVGSGVRDLAVGARVVGGTNFARRQRGSYADEVVVRPDQCAVLPDAVGYDEAASLPVAAVTAWMSLVEHARATKGTRVLVLGAAGGVGLAAIQLAKMLGATSVGVCSTRNVELVERLGAIAIDYTRGAPLAAAREHGPFDLVVHAVGTATYPLRACRPLLARRGIVDLVAVRPMDYPIVLFSRRVRTLLGRPTRERLTPLVEALARGDLTLPIAARIPFADAERAHQLSRAGKVVGKLLLLP
jgi:NADPH:quinone reductase-like Zn-dependent oxidoreductase